MTDPDPVLMRHRELEQIAMVALRAGRLLMESGARAKVVHQCGRKVAVGLGAEDVSIRSGYASLTITVANGLNTITRMVDVGPHGVNHRMDQALRRLAMHVGTDFATPQAVTAELDRLQSTIRRHPPWLVAVAVGVACASFGRLFGLDWAGFMPVVIAGTLGQYIRHRLLARHINACTVAGVVSFLSAVMGGVGAQLSGSGTVNLALMASVLLLVPGVPALNAQTDIMEGAPSLGSARAVTVLMIMMFLTVGLWLAQSVLGVG